MKTILILGSGPDVLAARAWPRAPFTTILAINNAWQVRPDWTILIHPEDFPPERRPRRIAPQQRIVTAADYVPAQNRLGGFVYAGGTMAFTASYWALDALRPRLIAYLGCDMVYPKGNLTHFYGTGTADPLRDDISLRSLEAKSARLMALAARQGCALVNLSQSASRLVFPRARLADLSRPIAPGPVDPAAMGAALRQEAALGYLVPSGRYWEDPTEFDTAALDGIDSLWRESVADCAFKSGLPCETTAQDRPLAAHRCG
ncbi:MAG: hypothetical protein U1D35_03515 [Paracoccaceae bacterium]|nr:hypothetical protein [Paracoccaceae bacterium]